MALVRRDLNHARMTLTAAQRMELATLDAIEVLGDVAHSTLIYLHLVGPFAHVSIDEREVDAPLVSHALKDLARVGHIVSSWLPGDLDALGRPRPTAMGIWVLTPAGETYLEQLRGDVALD